MLGKLIDWFNSDPFEPEYPPRYQMRYTFEDDTIKKRLVKLPVLLGDLDHTSPDAGMQVAKEYDWRPKMTLEDLGC